MAGLLEHANITVRSIDQTIQFLSKAFPEFKERGGGFLHGDEDLGNWVHFGSEDTYLAIQEMRNPVSSKSNDYEMPGLNHLGFVVEDVEALIARLQEAGYPLSPASAMEGHPYRKRAYFFDNNGFEWEFVEYLSDKAAERNDYTR